MKLPIDQSDLLSFFNLSSELLAVLDEEGRFLQLNPAWERVTGFPPSELLDDPFFDRIPTDDLSRAQLEFQKIHQKTATGTLECRCHRKAGDDLWVRWSVSYDREAKRFLLSGRDISDLKRVEKELAESRSKFDRLSESATEGVVIHENGVTREANQAFARLLGYDKPEEVIGRNGLDFVAPEYHQLVANQIRSGSEEPYEIIGIRKDGTRFHVRVQGKPIQYQGHTLRVTTFLDVTKTKKKEQELFESQELFRKLAEASKDGIAVSDKGVILMANPALAQMFGWEISEMIGRNALEFATPEFRDMLLQRVLSEAETPYELMGLRKDGSRFPLEITPRVTTTQGKRVRVAYFRDISQRKKIEEEVLRQKEFSQNLINSSVDGILAFDRECRYTAWNPAMERISGHSREEVLGQVAFDVFPFLKQIGEDVHFHSSLAGQTSFTHERPYRTPAGRQGFFEAHYMPIKNAKGEILGGLGIIRDITDRKRTQEALRQSELNLKAVFNNTFQNIILLDMEGRVLAFNANAAAAIKGWTGAELSNGMTFSSLLPSERLKDFQERFRKALQGEPIQFEQRFDLGEGIEEWMEVGYNPVFGDEGEIEGVCLVSNSIDDRKRSEEALLKSEADLRAIFDSSPQSLMLVGKDGLIRDFNQNARLGIRLARGQEVEKGRPLADYVEPEYQAAFQDRLKRVFRGETIRLERTVKTPNGSDIWYEFIYNPVFDRNGRVLGACASVISIEERKRSEAIIRESEEKFRRVFEDAAMAMAMAFEGRFIKANKAFLELLGYTEGELLGKSYRDITHPEDLPESDRIVASIQLQELDRFQTEKRYLKKNGEAVWVQLSGNIMRDEKGKILYSLLMVENIQERKEAQEALQRSEADLQAVFNNVSQSVVLLTPQGRVQSFNRLSHEMFKKALGLSLEKGKPFGDYVRPEDRQGYQDNLKKALAGEKVFLERCYRGNDGSEFWVEYGYNPVQDDQGRLIGVCFLSQRIDERKKAEQALRRSEAELRAVFNSGSQVTVLILPDGSVQDLNKSAEIMAQRVLGRNLTKGMSFIETLPPGASKEIYLQSFQAALEGRETRGERSIRAVDGKERWVEVRYQPALNEQGGVEGVCFSLTFIDERKRAEEALRESQERFERLALVTHEGILLHENPAVVDVNPALATMLGYNRDEMIGRPGFDFLAPEYHALAREHMVTGSTQPYEALALRKDGSTFPIELRGGNFPYKGRELRVMSVRDLTWHKAAEKILTESEERYRKLVELSPDAIVVHSGGEILYVNPAGLTMFEARERDPREFSLMDFLHPDYRDMTIARVKRIQETGKATDWVEQKLLRLNGEEFSAETKGTPFLYKGIPAVLTIVRDLTDRKQTQQTLLRYERLAAVGKVIAAIAHEVRNPLAVLTGMIQLLNAKMEGRKEYSQELKTILSQAERLRFFMNDILDYSREMEIKRTGVEVGALLEESLTAAQAQSGAKMDTVHMEIRVPKGLALLQVDRERMEQVLVNLITNAYQAVGKKGRMVLLAETDGDWMRLSVEDDGPGIPDADRAKIFEPFFTTKKHGSGLGLSISQKIVEAHGGKIEVERLQPHGTRFTVVLPLMMGV